MLTGTPCDNLTSPLISTLNKQVFNGNFRVFEDEATIMCNDGWEYPDGSKNFTVQCNATGLWNDTAPNCESMLEFLILAQSRIFFMIESSKLIPSINLKI